MPAPTFDTVQGIRLSTLTGYTLIYTLPSLDTPVCTRQTQELQSAAALFPDVNFVVISLDTPFALERFCLDKDITTVYTFSDARTRDFGLAHGLYMTEYALLTRAVLIVDDNLQVVHIDYVSEVTDEVDLLNAFAYLRDQGLMVENE
jgi:thiol peroxidase